MIRLDIDVLWVVIGFAERGMGFFMKVKGHIKEINDYEFGVDSNFESKIIKKCVDVFFHSFKSWSRKAAVDP